MKLEGEIETCYLQICQQQPKNRQKCQSGKAFGIGIEKIGHGERKNTNKINVFKKKQKWIFSILRIMLLIFINLLAFIVKNLPCLLVQDFHFGVRRDLEKSQERTLTLRFSCGNYHLSSLNFEEALFMILFFEK